MMISPILFEQKLVVASLGRQCLVSVMSLIINAPCSKKELTIRVAPCQEKNKNFQGWALLQDATLHAKCHPCCLGEFCSGRFDEGFQDAAFLRMEATPVSTTRVGHPLMVLTVEARGAGYNN